MKHFISFILLFIFIVNPLFAGEIEDVDTMLKDSIKDVVNLLKDQNIDKADKRLKVMNIIKSVFDIPLMGKLAIGKKYWRLFNKKNRTEFVRLFTKQLEHTYYGKAEFFSDEEILFEKPVKVKNKIYIHTKVYSKDKKIEVLYKFYKNHGTWKIYDAEIHGVSIISSFRAQYEEFLTTATVEDFMAKMKKKSTVLSK